MRAGACLGFGAMGYQSWEMAYGILEANKYILNRLVGPVAKGQNAKNNLTQKAKVSFGLCRVKATRLSQVGGAL